mmetsp:Transcript_90030/g.275609  ORF Transcript_90030/g.275609 Transcript_90030/m.275609 type:complete len:314 (+) Transcript_90030:736-1677(+)
MAPHMRSGRRQRNTRSFWKGTDSRRFQSSGNLTASGVSSLNHSLNLAGASFSMFVAKFSNPSSSVNFKTKPQFLLGNHSSKGFSAPITEGARKRKLKYGELNSSVVRRLAANNLKVSMEQKINLWASNNPRLTHRKMVMRIMEMRRRERSVKSSVASVRSIALYKKLTKDSREYWYMCSMKQSWMMRKNNIEPSAATGLYSSREVLISTSVTCAWATCTAISLDVALVFSRPSMSGKLSRIVAGSAADSWERRSSSSCESVTLNSFCFRTSSCFCCSSSGFSTFTTMARIWSSRPSGVTMKLMIVHWAAISGR